MNVSSKEIGCEPADSDERPVFYFDVSRYALIGPDRSTIKLRPQSLEVLVLLLRHANQMVSKQDILDAVWNGIAVTDDSVTQCIADIRRVLSQEHRSQLQTVPRVGYRLVPGVTKSGKPIIGLIDLPVAEQAVLDSKAQTYRTDAGAAPAMTKNRLARSWRILFIGAVGVVVLITALLLGNRAQDSDLAENAFHRRGPMLAVLPFENVGGAAEENYFTEGITEDIIALLSRFSELRLVSWRAVSSHAVKEERLNAVAAEYGVEYLLSGSVRQGDDRVRVAVQLTDASDARLLWSERYDESLQDVFLVQDRIAEQIVTTLSVKLTQVETQLSQQLPTSNIEAYQLSLLGRSEQRKRTREGNLSAREYFAQAIELDPTYTDAYIRLGETYLEDALFGWTEWPDQSAEKAMVLGKLAMEISGASARTLGFLALLHVRIGATEKAQEYIDRAFVFNPSDPSLHELQGLVHLWSGKATEAIDHLEYVQRYDPGSTLGLSHLSTAYYVAGRPVDAVAVIKRMMETAPDTLFNHIILAAASVEAGDIESAEAAAAVVRRQHPFMTAEGFSHLELFVSEEVTQRLITSLKEVGFE